MNFHEYSSRFEADVLSMCKPSSRATIGSHLRHLRFVFGPREMSEMTQTAIQKFITEEAKTKAPKTVKNEWGSLRQLLQQAHREGLLANLPQPALPKAADLDPQWFTPDQMRELAAASPLYAVFA